MASPWKALSDDNRRQIMLLLKNNEMIPTQIPEHLNFTLPAVSTSIRILKEADLITEIKKGKKQALFIEQEDDIRASTIL